MPFRTKFFREQEHNQEFLQGITHEVLYIIKKLLDLQWNRNMWSIIKKKNQLLETDPQTFWMLELTDKNF